MTSQGIGIHDQNLAFYYQKYFKNLGSILRLWKKFAMTSVQTELHFGLPGSSWFPSSTDWRPTWSLLKSFWRTECLASTRVVKSTVHSIQLHLLDGSIWQTQITDLWRHCALSRTPCLSAKSWCSSPSLERHTLQNLVEKRPHLCFRNYALQWWQK